MYKLETLENASLTLDSIKFQKSSCIEIQGRKAFSRFSNVRNRFLVLKKPNSIILMKIKKFEKS
jgi:hypothetical protein